MGRTGRVFLQTNGQHAGTEKNVSRPKNPRTRCISVAFSGFPAFDFMNDDDTFSPN